MAGPGTQDISLSMQRRKVRKGTQSCWSCRRRKVRCIFASTSDTVCNNCRRRRTQCISQELEDNARFATHAMRSTHEDHFEHRLRLSESPLNQSIGSEFTETSRTYRSKKRADKVASGHREPNEAQREPFLGRVQTAKDVGPATSSHPVSPTLPVVLAFEVNTVQEQFATLTRELLTAWPSPQDLDIITSVPSDLFVYLEGCLGISRFTVPTDNPPPPRHVLQMPAPQSHPILIALKLLLLGRFLQSIPPCSIHLLKELSRSHHAIMRNVTRKASTLVTCNNDLVVSLEGLECIAVEAMYYNYAGDLNKAWLTLRRGIAVAQMLGLDRSSKCSSVKVVDPRNQVNIRPSRICFRLVIFDRYLSLMLGFPQSSLTSNDTSEDDLATCSPIEKLERTHCVVSSHILGRKGACAKSMSEVSIIDTQMMNAGAEMPPTWWLIPQFLPEDSNSRRFYDKMIRVNSQFVHYHLLLRLHLPYMLSSISEHTISHSKFTAIYASREILARYISVREANLGRSYCHGTDFLVFIATAVICIAYITFHSQRQSPTISGHHHGALDFLQHGHPVDRGMMERALELLKIETFGGADFTASKVARAMQDLLRIEAYAADGVEYRTSQSNEAEDGSEPDGATTGNGQDLQVQIPSFGTIKFQRGTASRILMHDALVPATTVDLQMDNHVQGNCHAPQSQSTRDPTNAVHATETGPQPTLDNAEELWDNPELISRSATLLSDWDLQGIDYAFFDSLFPNEEVSGTIEHEDWTQDDD